MLESADPSKPAAARIEKSVILILPEAPAAVVDSARLRATLVDRATPLRVLLCLPEQADHALAALLANLNVETEILIGPQVDAPATTAFVLRAPPGTSSNDLTEFALALSDVVLIESTSAQPQLRGAAATFGKPIIVPGDRVPAVPPVASVACHLDPEVPGWHSRGRRCFGRTEQTALELLAYNWLGRENGGVAESRKRLKRCWGKDWRPSPYFAPESPEFLADLAPERFVGDQPSKIAQAFDALDRSALHGSYIHRDFTWIAYLLAAFAVFAAVAGHLFGDSKWSATERIFGIAEFLMLVLVLLLVGVARRTHLQERWTACRLGAEQLRIVRMSLAAAARRPGGASPRSPR